MARVTVRYFAVLRERRGQSQEELTVADGTTVGELYTSLFPPDARGRLPVAFARNRDYVRANEVVADGDEIAFLPPLGGG